MKTIIHYCWFGRKPLSVKTKKCIESWKRFFPDSEIVQWNETNFDVNCNQYVSQAYNAGKWAFVSDYCRFWAIEQFGGVYFDTDVEVIKSFDNLLEQDAFVGFETDTAVNPGLVLYVKNPHNTIVQETMNWYNTHAFLDDDGKRIKINVCGIFGSVLQSYGFVQNGKMQKCGNITVYPREYFCPLDDATGILSLTENTYTIHWFDKSWMSKRRIIRNRISRVIHRLFGVDIKDKIMRVIK